MTEGKNNFPLLSLPPPPLFFFAVIFFFTECAYQERVSGRRLSDHLCFYFPVCRTVIRALIFASIIWTFVKRKLYHASIKCTVLQSSFINTKRL